MDSKFVTVFLVFLPGLAAGWYNAVLDFPREPSVENYVMWSPDQTESMQSAFSICSWFRSVSTDTRNRWWISYQAQPDADVEDILLADTVNGASIFSTNMGVSSPALEKRKWYHMCQTWDLSTRTAYLYVDGKSVGSKGTAAGRKLPAGGIFVLGQEQDRPGSNFDANQAFVGQLYQLNMYGRALTGQEIERVFNRGRCASSDPNLLRDIVISWWVLILS